MSLLFFQKQSKPKLANPTPGQRLSDPADQTTLAHLMLQFFEILKYHQDVTIPLFLKTKGYVRVNKPLADFLEADYALSIVVMQHTMHVNEKQLSNAEILSILTEVSEQFDRILDDFEQSVIAFKDLNGLERESYMTYLSVRIHQDIHPYILKDVFDLKTKLQLLENSHTTYKRVK